MVRKNKNKTKKRVKRGGMWPFSSDGSTSSSTVYPSTTTSNSTGTSSYLPSFSFGSSSVSPSTNVSTSTTSSSSWMPSFGSSNAASTSSYGSTTPSSTSGWFSSGTSTVTPSYSSSASSTDQNKKKYWLFGGKKRMYKKGGTRGWTPTTDLASHAAYFNGPTARAQVYVGGKKTKKHIKAHKKVYRKKSTKHRK